MEEGTGKHQAERRADTESGKVCRETFIRHFGENQHVKGLLRSSELCAGEGTCSHQDPSNCAEQAMQAAQPEVLHRLQAVLSFPLRQTL